MSPIYYYFSCFLEIFSGFIAISNVSDLIIIIMSKIKITASILKAFVKTQGKGISSEVTRTTN